MNAITVDALNPCFSSLDGVLFDKSQTMLIECPGGKSGSYAIPHSVTNIATSAFEACNLTNIMIPNSVTGIGDFAFSQCYGLTSMIIPNSVTNIGDWGFDLCTELKSAYFLGNVPSIGSWVFLNDDKVTVYYLPGAAGWGPTFGGRPTALWLPQMLTSGSNFGAQSNGFGFNINWASGMTVVIEACSNLANPLWFPVETNTITGGSSYFSDPRWTNYPGLFYRIRSQ